MQNSPALPLGILLSTVMISCGDISVTPGNTTTTARTVSGFTKLDVANGFEVTIIPDGTESASIEAPEGYQPYINTVVEAGTLKVYFDDRVDANEAAPKRATIHVKSLDGISVSGGCRVTATDTLRSSNFTLEASGGSSLTLLIAMDLFGANASGGSIITLSGTASGVTFGASGGSTVHAFDLLAEVILISASGGSTLEVQASGPITINASGGSHIYYKGTLESVHLSGGSEAIKK